MAKDGFDSKISYIVDVNFTNSSPANDADFASENFPLQAQALLLCNRNAFFNYARSCF